MDETRIEKRDTAAENWPFVDIIGADGTKNALQDTGATQRVYVSAEGTPAKAPTPPVRRTPTSGQNRQNPPQRRTAPTTEQRASAAAARRKKEQITIISLCAAAAVLLIAVIIVIIATVSAPNDNGLIMDNVFAAGVDLGGMTTSQAKKALKEATDDTYTQLDMTVQVLDSTITLSPKDTGAKLDIDAVVDAAYKYGRDGERTDNAAHTISILPYLTLDTGYIENAVSKLGRQYSTTLSQTTYTVEGQRPTAAPDPETVDLNKAYQTLHITIGTAEYGLNTDRLYEQIMEAYNINLFQVTGECSVVAPDELDCELLYEELCSAPVDASMDPATYVVTPEIYGYGFLLEDLKAQVAAAKFGETLSIPLCYIEPDITTKILSEDLFRDTLASFRTNAVTDANWINNMVLACEALNGVIVKSGEEFSFNEIVGEPTTRQGYKAVEVFVGKSLTNMVGGGISQVSSALYYCALLADLDILERNPHTYCPSFINTGLDAQVYYGSMDLRLRNNTEQPIRIEAQVIDGAVQINLIGTDTKEYSVDIVFEITATKKPGTDTLTLGADNPGGYKDGDVITKGITGYTVSTFKYTYDKDSGRQLSEDLIATSSYAKRNTLVVKLQDVQEPNPSDPSEPDPSDDTSNPTSDSGN